MGEDEGKKKPSARARRPAARRTRVSAKKRPEGAQSAEGVGEGKRVAARAKKPGADEARKTAAKKTSAAGDVQSPKKATAKRAATKESAAKKSATKKSAAKKSATKKSAAKKSATKKSAAKKSATKKSAAKKSATKKSATKKAATKKAATKKDDAAEAESGTAPTSGARTRIGRPAKARRRGGEVTRAPEDDEGAVLLTGICGRLGRLLTRQLHRVTEVVGVDRRPFHSRPKDVVHYQLDVRRKKTRDIFRQRRVRAVVHLGVLHDLRKSDKEHHSWNVVAFTKLLDYLAQYDVPKLVVLSSSNVYGPQPDNPQFLTEEAPLLGAQHFRGIRDLVEMDMLAQSFFWRHPNTETVILRPCHILGGVRNAPSNYLRLERPMTVMGFDPMVQVIHERDVVSAIIRALEPGVRGIFNLRGPGEAPLSRLFRMLGRKPRAVPGALAQTTLEQMWRYRLTSFPSPELDHIRYVCMVDDRRARETLGFSPRYDLKETVASVDADR